MKFKLFFYGFLNQNERFIQILLSSALSIFFFYRYYKSQDTILFLFAALLFLLTTVIGFISLKKKTNLLKRLNKAKIKVEHTKSSLFLYSDYKKYRNLFVLVLFLSMSGGLSGLIIRALWIEGTFDILLTALMILFLMFSFFILLFIYYLFLPKITLQRDSISYQLINLKRMSLFESIKFDDLREIGLGKFEGYFYNDNSMRDSPDTLEKKYYWLLYGIGYDKKRHIFIDFDNQ